MKILNSDTSKRTPLAPERVQAIYDKHVVALERFLLGVLRDEAAASDALQSSLIKLMEKGHLVQQQDSMRSWLFRVAFNEAMLIKRKASIGRKHAQGIAWKSELSAGADKGADPRLSQSVHHAIRQEEIVKVREALTRIPKPQRDVVELRIYEGLKFREIADKLGEPLGTVLARMQAGLKKLKPILKESLNELNE
ncbi:MAG: RNA polymerase sigma factor [Planctomycetota bacterium]